MEKRRKRGSRREIEVAEAEVGEGQAARGVL
jgi:hypothetical protein